MPAGSPITMPIIGLSFVCRIVDHSFLAHQLWQAQAGHLVSFAVKDDVVACDIAKSLRRF